ncbi:hypothetical protein CM49_06648 [Paenibacillus sp. P1XP2]|nr:hypothetical protein CM49_06648 [Paenibacillus sp. P1XP2]
MLLRLPPILYRSYPNPISSCSKAPWGLSVLSRVTCIFTGIKISPDLSLRQRPSRYAIRAGQNLPDKEFRYLRTVIVTAAVYWGFGSQLRSYSLTAPLNLPAPGRRQPYTSPYGFAQTCVFAKQSLGPFHCGPLVLFTLPGHPFSRSYGVILPSSLTRVLPRALEFSSRLPVSVCGTGTFTWLEAFLGSVRS